MDKTVVLLVGAQGSGKTTYCREHLPDYYRISQDDQGRHGHLSTYEEALDRGEPRVVVDRINNLKSQRQRYLAPARQKGYRTRIVWLNVSLTTALRRCRDRTDHPTLPPEECEKAVQLYFKNLQYPSRREADELVLLGPPPAYVPVLDLTAVIGSRRHLIVGDIHGCFDELQDLLTHLEFVPGRDVLLSVGDVVDRGPKVKEVVEFLFGLPDFYMALGNHDDKFLRLLRGSNVKVSHGLETTIDSFGGAYPPWLADRLAGLPLILKCPSGYVVHAGFDPEMAPEEQSRSDCLYMRYYGGKTYFDAINGRPWYTLWPEDWPRVFFGHIPDPDGPCLPHVCSLDAGCVFGGALKAFDSRDGQVHHVKARQQYAVSELTTPATTTAPPALLKTREDYVVAGLLRGDRTDDGTLAIYTYTDQCVYESHWDEVTRNARGHVYNLQTGECVAWAFPKFFNLGENAESRPECFPWDQPYEIYEKMDGWLGVLYRHEGRFKVASRGSFHSSGATWATEFIRQHDLSSLPEDVTLCFEIIHPEHKIILDYSGQRTLVILAAFNRHTGAEYPRADVVAWGQRAGLPVVPLLAPMSLEDLKRNQKATQQFEGFVVRFADGRRVKVKTEWYLEIARLMANLNPIAVWEAMKGGKLPEAYLQQLPEELRPLAERYRAVLEGQYARALLEIDRLATPVLQQFGTDRKALALYLNEHKEALGYVKPAVFLLLDGRRDKLEKVIMDLIYPTGNQFAADAAVVRPAG